MAMMTMRSFPALMWWPDEFVMDIAADTLTVFIRACFLSAPLSPNRHAPLGTCPGVYPQLWARGVWMDAGVFLR